MPYTKDDRIKFRHGKQKELIRFASNKVGSLRKLSEILGIRFGYFWYYISEQVTLPQSTFIKLVKISNLDEELVHTKYVEQVLPYNWGKVKGSIETNRIVKERLKYPSYRKRWYRKYLKLRKVMKGKLIKNWEMGFRKAGRRNAIGPKGERMFNDGERKIAEFLLSRGLEYEYEPKLQFGEKVYFPDFVSGGFIIERFGMTTPLYIERSVEKLRKYIRLWNGKILILVPKNRLSLFNRVLPRSEKKLLVVPEETLNEMSRVA